MISRYEGTCPECDKAWYKGSVIVQLLGRWVHEDCKTRHLTEKLAGGHTAALPSHRGAIETWASRKQATGKRGPGKKIVFSGL